MNEAQSIPLTSLPPSMEMRREITSWMLGGLLGGGVQVDNEDINGRSFPYLCICPSAPKAKRPVYSPLVPSSLSPNRLVSKTGPA